jgi:hypothetical protein
MLMHSSGDVRSCCVGARDELRCCLASAGVSHADALEWRFLSGVSHADALGWWRVELLCRRSSDAVQRRTRSYQRILDCDELEMGMRACDHWQTDEVDVSARVVAFKPMRFHTALPKCA